MSNATEALRKITFIEKILPTLIVEKTEEFVGYEVVNCRAELNKQLNGFMSAIYDVQLTMKAPGEKRFAKKSSRSLRKIDLNFLCS